MPSGWDGGTRRRGGAAIGDDFIHLALNVPPTPLRRAVDAALRGEPSINVFEVESTEAPIGEPRLLEVTCYPEQYETDGGTADAVAVVVTDITTREWERRDLEQAVTREHDEAARVAAQMERLAETNRQLVSANQELTTTNAELRSANEELLVVTEETQAATEEVETLNEELQATNEELETLNEELQATVEELNTTNDDLQARSIELQDLAMSLEAQQRASDAERARLAAILETMADAMVLIDAAGTPMLTNAA